MYYPVSGQSSGKRHIRDLELNEILPYSLFTTPIVPISKQDKIWVATAMLRFFLESLTDQLVVIENKTPCGLIGGYDIINNILKNPRFDLFENESVEKIMHHEITQISKTTKMNELLENWQENRRAFSIINDKSRFFAVSVRTILGTYPFMDTNLIIQDIPKKKIIHYTNDQSVKEILELMLQNKTRRLVLENTESYISDRVIIEKICTDLNYLYGIDNFLDMKCSIFQPIRAKTVPPYTTIQKLCEVLYSLEHAFIISDGQVISPFDIVSILQKDDVYAKTAVMPA